MSAEYQVLSSTWSRPGSQGDQYHWMFPRLSGLLDASPVAYICTPPVFSSISASRQRNLHMKEQRSIQWGGTNGLSSVTFYWTGLLCQYFCIVNITRTFRLSSNENFSFFLLLQKRWSLAASLGEAWDRLNATHRSRGKDYYMGCVWFFLIFPDLGLLFRHGRTGFRCSGASPVGARRPGAPSRLSDRSLGPQLRAACRSLPAGEILPLAHTNGSPLRSVKARLCGACHKGMQLVKCYFFSLFRVSPLLE